MRLRTPVDFGAAIREKRRALGLDQAALAERVGVSRQWIVGVEKGKPRAAMQLVLRTLDALGIALWTEQAPRSSLPSSMSGAPVDLGRVLDAHRGPRRTRS